MSKIGKSLLRGAKEALTYAKGKKPALKHLKLTLPKKINAKKKSLSLDVL